MNDIENTILAFCEWADENADGYLTVVTKNGKSICVLSDETDKLVASLATALEKMPILKSVFEEAVSEWARSKIIFPNQANDDTSL